MESLNYAKNACKACHSGKRKCDRVIPVCGTCIRANRQCVYYQNTASEQGSQRNGPFRSSQDVRSSWVSMYNVGSETNPDTYVRMEILKTFGTVSNAQACTRAYFDTTYKLLPIIRQTSFETAWLGNMTQPSTADNDALALAMFLVQQRPQPGITMQSPQYTSMKSIIGVLEANGHSSLRLVQCRILVAWYENAHALHPAASISIAACAKAGRSIGLHEQNFADYEGYDLDQDMTEERRRVWWAIINLDRYFNFLHGDSCFGMEDTASNAILPKTDRECGDVNPRDIATTAGVAPDIAPGQFARECQGSFLLGRVIRHCLKPLSDLDFQDRESAQLERTLLAYIPLLSQEDLVSGRFCTIMCICASALFLLHERSPARMKPTEDIILRVSAQLSFYANVYPFTLEDLTQDVVSPYIPLTLYQTVLLLRRMQNRVESNFPYDGEKTVRILLQYYAQRWSNADYYLRLLDAFDPPFLPFAAA